MKSCEHCKHWFYFETADDYLNDVGSCQRDPPTETHGQVAVYAGSCKCGEFSALSKKKYVAVRKQRDKDRG